MNKLSKPFYISILLEWLIAIILRQTQWLWYNNEIFLNHIIERILIAIIWPIIWITRNSKEKNTILLKKWLIIVEIYLFLLIFVQDWINLNKREFFILYLSVLLIIKETIYKREKKRQTTFFIVIYSIISFTIICTWLLMWYRKPIDMNNIINSKNYYLTTIFEDNITNRNNQNNIVLKNEYFEKNISIINWKTNYDIIKNMDYSLEFSSKTNSNSNYIIIQDQLWNILKIPPQTSITFSTKNQQIKYIDNTRNCEYYSIYNTLPEELEEFQLNYKEQLKEDILNTLPSMLRNNSKLQKISTTYTKILWTIFPFRYKENINILNNYVNYFDLNDKKEYESVKNKYNIFSNNWNIGLDNINWFEKYKIF